MPVDSNVSRWLPAGGGAPIRAQTSGDLLDEAAQRSPDQEAVVYPDLLTGVEPTRWTYSEYRSRAREVASALIASGHQHGDRIAIWATNLPEWLIIQLGAAYLGAVVVPLNPLFRQAEVGHILRASGARTLFALPENRGSSLWDLAFACRSELPELDAVIALGDAPDDRGPSFEDWLVGFGPFDEDLVTRRSASVSADDLAQIQFTSGTTGAPKGAALPHLGLVNNARLFFERAEFAAGTRYCSPLPFFHTGGSSMSALGAIATQSAFYPLPTFDAEAMVRIVDAEQVIGIQTVPTMLLELERQVDRGAGTLETVDTVVVGGATIPADVCARWQQRFGVAFTVVYGLTESSPVITQTSPSDPPELQFSNCGIAYSRLAWDVADPSTGEAVDVGAEGEVRVRGWSVMQCYYGEQAATDAAITEDGWLRTGDLGRMDVDGRLWVTGRRKDLIIRGGENIYPSEIEAALRALSAVAEAAVVGIQDDYYGEQPVAFVTESGEGIESGAALRSELDGKLARYKIPAAVEIVDALPATASGKVQRFKLREKFLEDHPDGVVGGRPKPPSA